MQAEHRFAKCLPENIITGVAGQLLKSIEALDRFRRQLGQNKCTIGRSLLCQNACLKSLLYVLQANCLKPIKALVP